MGIMTAKGEWMKVFGRLIFEIDQMKASIRQIGDGSKPIIDKLDDINADLERLYDEKVAEWEHLDDKA
jgi:hypothetical protein